jgi:hypothetical protein
VEKYYREFKQDILSIPMYPYYERHVQGEPNNGPHPQPHYVVANISPQALHRTAYVPAPAYGGPPASRQRSSSHANPEYVKRPRRRAEEVDRKYACNYPGCDKAYGALNHLNTHVRNTNHGPKREPKGLIFWNCI